MYSLFLCIVQLSCLYIMVMLKSIVSGSFLYNRAGEILQVLRPDNRQTTYERDAFGRINRADYSDGSWEAFSYDKGGLLCGATYANSRIVFQRDDLECVISEQQLLSEGTSEDGIQIESEYNLFGGRIWLVSSLGAEQTAGYNGIGLLEQLQPDREGSKRRGSNIRYDEAGREIERFASGGLSIQSQYDTYGSMSGRFVYKGKEQREVWAELK